MSALRVQVVIPADNLLPADACVNVFHFLGTGSALATFAVAKPRLVSFYDAWSSYRSPLYDWVNVRLKAYDMDQPSPRPPIADELAGTTAAAAGTGLPAEVCMCMSFQGDRLAGANQARRRGRVYLGPLSASSNNGATARPDTTFTTTLTTAARTFLLASDGVCSWCVRSEAAPPADYVAVTNGWFDNAFDTQRRRGFDPSSRQIFNNIP